MPSLSWLDEYFGPAIVKLGSVLFPKRSTLEFVAGSGTTIAVEDVPASTATKVTISSAGGGGGGGGGGTPSGALGQVQFYGVEADVGEGLPALFGGSPNLTFPSDWGWPTFSGIIDYPGPDHSGTRSVAFTASVTDATEPLVAISVPVHFVAHSGIVQLVAHARTATSTSTQILLVPYTYAGGTLTLGAVIDQTPAALVDAQLTASITSHGSGLRYIDVVLTAAGDTNWSGQLQITMADTP